ncbi:DUF1816 domain-containing protein [Nostoc sp. KVJ3]|jgi:glucan phosphorylase|uniref:DUF1816 domain-containing protein n=1 Tax=Nostoc sp. KVJ3 TaxID=457945 RepID=UPI002238DAD2|nr:DUF1816 domain-containing protein [Nostoc sp. KVJ3]MCW5319430.1 DUF1816 domain-containing protein [Nostoc sp. KVJ3]
MNLFQSNQSEFAWWVEINTAVPRCTYYFGPFDNKKEAQLSRSGYVEDLYQEEARDIIALVKQCQPDVITIFQEKAEVQIFSF